MPTAPAATNQKHDRRLRLGRPLEHHIAADRLKRSRIVQVYQTLGSRLRPGTAWVIFTVTDDHTPPTIRNVGELQAEHLAGTKPAVQHEAYDCEITPRAQLAQQRGTWSRSSGRGSRRAVFTRMARMVGRCREMPSRNERWRSCTRTELLSVTRVIGLVPPNLPHRIAQS